jgi:tellurite resistance protein TehA-like permease
MNWFSFIFPNTALTTATLAIAKAFNSTSIAILGCIMACFLILAWFLVVGMMFRAIILHQILWPQKGEDKDEGGFKTKEVDASSTSTDSP